MQEITKKNVLITGSAGFIMRNMIELLERNYSNHYELFHVDSLQEVSDKKFWETLPKERKLPINVMSISDSLLENWNIDYVIHAAARSHVDDSIKNPMSFTYDNILATHYLLEACRKYGKLEKFVLVSTDEVLGSLDMDDHAFREDDPIKPNSPYSASKAAQELLARSYHETFGLPIVITRCSNNYGPWQDGSKLIPKAIKCLFNGEKIPVYGTGTNVRDWIHVNDHCRGIISAIERGKVGETYHFGGNNEMTNIEVLKELIYEYIFSIETNCSNNEAYENVEEKYFSFVEDRPGHDKRYAMNSQKAYKDLNWSPSEYSNPRHVLDWAFKNKEWLNK